MRGFSPFLGCLIIHNLVLPTTYVCYDSNAEVLEWDLFEMGASESDGLFMKCVPRLSKG